MTAIRPTDSVLIDKIDTDAYNNTLNSTNAKYTEMDKYITNLESDILSIKDFSFFLKILSRKVLICLNTFE